MHDRNAFYASMLVATREVMEIVHRIFDSVFAELDLVEGVASTRTF
jgi:hypothetical protein